MVKKFLLASSILAITTGVAMANPVPYIGAGLGIVNNTADIKINGTTFTGGAYRGIPVNVFAGYGGVINQNFYLAGELYGTITTANVSNSNGLKTTYSYGASIIPGVMLNETTLAYVRAGIQQSRFSEVSDTITGGQFGAGLQTCLMQNVDVRLEYDLVAYESKNVSFASISPRSDQTTVSLIYKFD